MRYRVGIDAGGTFTDLIVWNEDTKDIATIKVPSIPKKPELAIMNAIKDMTRSGISLQEVRFLSHGTTVGTNALLEGKGARVGLLVTEGFRGINDVYQVSISGPDIYRIYDEMPKALVPSRFCEEIRERVDFKGKVIVPLDRRQAIQAVRRLKKKKVEAIAVCLLFAFVNPSHERELKEIVKQEYPECEVYLSSETLPQIREFTRLSTTLANAEIGPILAAYLTALETKLRYDGLKTKQLYVMQSNGGVATFNATCRHAVATLLSGPAAGAVATRNLATLTGHANVVGLDMGGTSCDVSLIKDGEVEETTRGLVGKWETGVPMLQIITIGAGGGTIARVDEAGMLKVGPQSAGADPGPVCYDTGGTEVTVTDAHVVLGNIHPDSFLGGKLKLNKQKAEMAIEERIARPLDIGLMEAAYGIIRIVNAHMEQAIKSISTERGYDVREFMLVAFGGAGPLHATQLAVALRIPKVIVPLTPGLTSAEGLLGCDGRHDYMRTKLELLSAVDTAQVNSEFAELTTAAVTELVEEGFSSDEVSISRYLDLRYVGQGYEVTVPVPAGSLTMSELGATRTLFDNLHSRLFGHKAELRPVEIVNYRVVACVTVPKIEPRRYEKVQTSADEVALKERRRVYFGKSVGEILCPVYSRESLNAGHTIDGPAIVEQMDSTTLVYPNQRIQVDPYKNLIISISSSKEGK